MRFFRLLSNFAAKQNPLKHTILTARSLHHVKFKSNLSRQILVTHKVSGLSVHTESDENDEADEIQDYPVPEAQQIEWLESARDTLFKYSNDSIINELNKCVSVEEVLNLVKRYGNDFKDAHITQAIFILKDLQNMCHHYSSGVTAKQFLENLYKNKEFDKLINRIEELSSFNPKYLSYVLLYLNKLGIPAEDQIIQKISMRIRDHLVKKFSLDICSRFLKVVFTEGSVRPYYMSLDLIPIVASQIGKCKSVEDLGNLTECLNRLHNIVTNKLLNSFKDEIRDFLHTKKLKGTDYPVLLKIISFLNYPKWREENVLLISDCILLMKDEISVFNVKEIITLYEVFFKNQEPGDILNNIQRCSAQHLQRFETEPLDIEAKLKLFSSLIYFSSPTHRVQFRKEIHKYIKQCYNYSTLVLIRKILSYIKISDVKLCASYWNLSLQILDSNPSTQNVLKLCQNYMYFNTDINNYRHYKFEHRIMKIIQEAIKCDTLLFPSTMSGYLSFAMVYGRDQAVLKVLMDKFENNLSQFKAVDCLKLSRSVLLVSDIRDGCVSKQQVDVVKELLNKRTEDLLAIDENNILQNSMLLRASILRDDYDNYIVDSLLMKYKEINFMSSKILENICHIFLCTDSLIPEVINRCTEYVINNPGNILGFNAEKILTLCFYMAYYPINADRFFQVVTDIIIRDQERLSGLAFLQTALSLCYFNKLPSSFIKQIFNVEFLEKLDVELANCYSKDKYPQRVRNSLMQLNRAVCLEYPEYNVPWFHKKFIEEKQMRFVKDMENQFPLRIKEYLIKVLGKEGCILQDVITPYGYHIDFVVSLNNKEEAVMPSSNEIKRKVALLLMRHHGFTRFYTHLKGKYQLKKRHLEILGYGVVIIKFNEWVNLLYAEERLEYLSKIIWPNNLKHSVNTYKR